MYVVEAREPAPEEVPGGRIVTGASAGASCIDALTSAFVHQVELRCVDSADRATETEVE